MIADLHQETETTGSRTYTPETVKEALIDIINGTLSICKASKFYKIPQSTLYDHLNGKYKQDHPGAPTVLTADEEAQVVENIGMMTSSGFPVTKKLLLNSVQQLVATLGRANKFKNGLPGRHWYAAFLKRNPTIKHRISRTITASRGGATEEQLRAWFSRVQKYFGDNHLVEVLDDPSKIFNCVESTVFLCPKSSDALSRKSAKSGHFKSGNDDKERLTLLLGASAGGNLMPILALLPNKRKSITKYPEDWYIGKSDNGWMTPENFYEYITNIFNPFIIQEKIEKPVVIFLECRAPYLSLNLCQFCKENGIILVALPNNTYALQPMEDVLYDLKTAWSKDINTWRKENNENRIKREDFGSMLDITIKKTLRQKTIKNGFRKCGLYPFDVTAVDFSRSS